MPIKHNLNQEVFVCYRPWNQKTLSNIAHNPMFFPFQEKLY